MGLVGFQGMLEGVGLGLINVMPEALGDGGGVEVIVKVEGAAVGNVGEEREVTFLLI